VEATRVTMASAVVRGRGADDAAGLLRELVVNTLVRREAVALRS